MLVQIQYLSHRAQRTCFLVVLYTSSETHAPTIAIEFSNSKVLNLLVKSSSAVSASLPSPTATAAHATAAAPAPAAHAAAAAAAVGDLLAGLVLGLDRVVDEQGVER